jgi:NadR type nicotinamide-nucleotide adenylyltransferase
MIRVVILGPESTGKSTLARKLAAHFHTRFVPEFARGYIDQLQRPYNEEDLLKIAEGQIKSEDEIEEIAIEEGLSYLFYDTDLTVIKIWSEYKYNRLDPWILDQIHLRRYDYYLLTYPDLEWEPDPQRENQDDRYELFNLYLKDLKSRNLSFSIIDGVGEARFKKALEIISSISQE